MVQGARALTCEHMRARGWASRAPSAPSALEPPRGGARFCVHAPRVDRVFRNVTGPLPKCRAARARALHTLDHPRACARARACLEQRVDRVFRTGLGPLPRCRAACARALHALARPRARARARTCLGQTVDRVPRTGLGPLPHPPGALASAGRALRRMLRMVMSHLGRGPRPRRTAVRRSSANSAGACRPGWQRAPWPTLSKRLGDWLADCVFVSVSVAVLGPCVCLRLRGCLCVCACITSRLTLPASLPVRSWTTGPMTHCPAGGSRSKSRPKGVTPSTYPRRSRSRPPPVFSAVRLAVVAVLVAVACLAGGGGISTSSLRLPRLPLGAALGVPLGLGACRCQ